jgi:hypothetical protein
MTTYHPPQPAHRASAAHLLNHPRERTRHHLTLYQPASPPPGNRQVLAHARPSGTSGRVVLPAITPLGSGNWTRIISSRSYCLTSRIIKGPARSDRGFSCFFSFLFFSFLFFLVPFGFGLVGFDTLGRMKTDIQIGPVFSSFYVALAVSVPRI